MNASQFGGEVAYILVGWIGWMLVGELLFVVCFSLFVAPLIGCTVRFFKIDIDLQVVFQAVKKRFFFQKVKHLAEAIFPRGEIGERYDAVAESVI